MTKIYIPVHTGNVVRVENYRRNGTTVSKAETVTASKAGTVTVSNVGTFVTVSHVGTFVSAVKGIMGDGVQFDYS